MGLSLVTAPASEPLTIAEIKAHLRFDSASGEPAPTAITVALVSPAVPGLVDVGAHRYLLTFVTADGETDAGAISAPVTIVNPAVNGAVALTNLPIGGSAVMARTLYRTTAGGSIFLRCATLSDNTSTSAVDSAADSSLGAQAPTVNTTDDPQLVSWNCAARQWCETFTHRAFITQTWMLTLDQCPAGPIWLPKPPLVSVTSVTYVDPSGVTQPWDPTLYTVDAPRGPWARVGRLEPAYLQYYPLTRPVSNAVAVTFVAGYGAAAAVPAPIKSAMKLLIGNWWSNREAGAIVRASADVLPFGVEALLWPFKAF